MTLAELRERAPALSEAIEHGWQGASEQSALDALDALLREARAAECEAVARENPLWIDHHDMSEARRLLALRAARIRRGEL